MSKSTFGRLRRREGQALAEMAVVLPVLLLMIFGIIELSNAWRTFQVVTNSTREGARVAVLPTATQTQVEDRVIQGLESGNLNDPDREISIQCFNSNGGSVGCFGTGGTGNEARIRVQYPYTFTLLGPIVQYACAGACPGGFGTITIASTSTMRIE